MTAGSLGNPQALESTASRLLRESGAPPVQFALPPGYAAPATSLPGLGAPARPEVSEALASVRNLAAEALRRSEEDWKKAAPAKHGYEASEPLRNPDPSAFYSEYRSPAGVARASDGVSADVRGSLDAPGLVGATYGPGAGRRTMKEALDWWMAEYGDAPSGLKASASGSAFELPVVELLNPESRMAFYPEWMRPEDTYVLETSGQRIPLAKIAMEKASTDEIARGQAVEEARHRIMAMPPGALRTAAEAKRAAAAEELPPAEKEARKELYRAKDLDELLAGVGAFKAYLSSRNGGASPGLPEAARSLYDIRDMPAEKFKGLPLPSDVRRDMKEIRDPKGGASLIRDYLEFYPGAVRSGSRDPAGPELSPA